MHIVELYIWYSNPKNKSYVATFVHFVISQFDFFERYNLFVESIARERSIWMHEQSRLNGRVCFAGHKPRRAVIRITVSLTIRRHDVHRDNILLMLAHAQEWHAQRRKHASTRLGDDHLGAEFVESLPEIISLQVALDLVEFVGIVASRRCAHLDARFCHWAHLTMLHGRLILIGHGVWRRNGASTRLHATRLTLLSGENFIRGAIGRHRGSTATTHGFSFLCHILTALTHGFHGLAVLAAAVVVGQLRRWLRRWRGRRELRRCGAIRGRVRGGRRVRIGRLYRVVNVIFVVCLECLLSVENAASVILGRWLIMLARERIVKFFVACFK